MVYLNQNAMKLLPPGHHHSHRVIIISGVIISLFIIILAVTIANSRTSFFGRAAYTPAANRSGGALSLENSYLFASPLSGLSDGSSIIRVTAIILDDQGMGLSGQQVTLKSQTGLTITQTQPLTDTFGRAIFDLTSSAPGNYTISAELKELTLPATVSVSFR